MPDLDERFSSLRRVRAPDLWPQIEDRESARTPFEPSPGRRWLAGAVAFAVAAAGLTFAATVFRSGDRLRPTSTVTNGKIAFSGFDGKTWQIYSVEPDGSGLTGLTHVPDLQVATDPDWSPDGARLAFVVQQFHEDGTTGRSDVWVMNADGSDPRQLADGPGSSWDPAWSPDGTSIAFARGDPANIYVVNADGTDTTRLSEGVVSVSDPSWSPDGSRIVFAGQDAGGEKDLYVLNTDGTGEARLLDLPGWQVEPTWSPDGRWIAFTGSSVDGAEFGIHVIDADGTNLRSLTNQSAQSPSWSPDGRQIAFMAPRPGTDHDTLYVMNADGSDVHELSGLPTEATSPSWQPVLVEPIPSVTPTPAPGTTPKANGPIYFRVGGGDGPSWIESILPDGSGRHIVFDQDSPVHFDRIAFSPDGARIAFDNALVGHFGIYTASPDGSGIVQLTDGVNDSWASWSPDGSKILFSSTRYDPSLKQCEPGADFTCPTDIYVMDADGSSVVRLTSDEVPDYAPRWSPDGSRIAFVRVTGGAGPTAIFTMNPDGSDVRRVSSAEGGSDFSPSWSADGSQIAFGSIRYEDWSISIVNADGSDEHAVMSVGGFVYDPVFSPDGNSIAFIGCCFAGADDTVDQNALYVMRPDGTQVRKLADAPIKYGVAGDIAWQPLVSGSPPVEPSPAPSELASVDVRVTTTHGVAEFPSAVAAGEGGVWVTAPRQDGSGAGEVIRLDPNTGDIVARIPVRAAPAWDFGGAGLTVAEGSVWLVDSVGARPTCCHAFVTRIDPSTNAVVDEIELPGDGTFGADLWVDGSSIYVLSWVESWSTLELAKVDAASHALEWRAPVPGQWSQTVFVAGGSVWVAGTPPDAHGPIEVTMLYRMDPATGAVIDQIPFTDSSLYIPALHADTLWFRTTDGAQRFDTASASQVGEPVQPAPGCCTGAFVSDGAGGVWVLSSPGAGAERSIWHIDASGTVVASGTIDDRQVFEEMRGQSYAFDPVTQTIWVQHYADSVSRVEITPATHA